MTMEPGAEIILFILLEPQWEQIGGASCVLCLCRISDTLPQSTHLYS
jgi:hypothetical protein